MGWVGDRGELADVVARWQQMRVVVVGDSFVDEWWYGQPQRLSREAPVPVVDLGRVQRAPGGAANTAVNMAALGARPVLVTPVSDDPDGHWLQHCLTEAGVEVLPVAHRGTGTPVKRRMVADGQIVLRVDTSPQDNGAGPGTELVAATEVALAAAAAAMVVCDYDLGALSEGFVAWLREQRAVLPLLAVDSHHLGRWRDVRPTLVKPNFAEMAELLDTIDHWPDAVANRASTVERHAELILDRTGTRIAAVTLDIEGAMVLDGQVAPIRTATQAAPASHAVGAGDAYLAALTLAVASGAPLTEAATVAQRAAAASVQGPRTCVTRIDALLADAGSRPSMPPRGIEDTLRQVRAARARGARLVFTNGCFDVLHHGHVGFLRQARELGDLLVVGLNSDASVARLKGPDRPVNNVDDRSAVLSALSCVDHVIVFEENSPEWLISELRPDVYVKGGDYHGDLLPEADLVRRLGGEVRILDYLPDRSTSSIIERIRSRTVEASRD